MKKVSLIMFVLFLGVCFKGFSQSAPSTDFFAGKWEVTIIGTPDGDAKMIADLTRKDGKLTGVLKDMAGKMPEGGTPLTKVEETAEKLTLYFEAQGMEINIALDKVDDDHLKGSLLNMFDATALRVKATPKP